MRCLMILLSVTIWLACALGFPIRDTSSRNALERRTNEPPGGGEIDPNQFRARLHQLEDQVLIAFSQDPELKARVYKILGIVSLKRPLHNREHLNH